MARKELYKSRVLYKVKTKDFIEASSRGAHTTEQSPRAWNGTRATSCRSCSFSFAKPLARVHARGVVRESERLAPGGSLRVGSSPVGRRAWTRRFSAPNRGPVAVRPLPHCLFSQSPSTDEVPLWIPPLSCGHETPQGAARRPGGSRSQCRRVADGGHFLPQIDSFGIVILLYHHE